jgi:zinc transport system permease protein
MAGEGYDLRRLLVRSGVAVTGLLAAVSALYLLGTFLEAYGPGPLGALGEAVASTLVVLGYNAGMLAGTDVLRFRFVWNSLATGVLVGIVGPLVGTYVVHREMALIGETLAHTAFAGVAFGLFLGSATGWSAPVLLPALVAGILGAFAVQWLAEHTDAYGDVPIAIMLTGSFALGTIVISVGGGFSGLNVESFLFGNVGFVTRDGAWLMGALSAVVVAVVAARHKQLLFITFDEQAARVAQLDVDRNNTLLVVLTAFVVVGAMQVLGIILVAALLVVPVAAAAQVARDFGESIALGVLFGEVSVLVGMVAAFALNSPAGGTIVVVAIGIYGLAVAASTVGFAARPTS